MSFNSHCFSQFKLLYQTIILWAAKKYYCRQFWRLKTSAKMFRYEDEGLSKCMLLNFYIALRGYKE